MREQLREELIAEMLRVGPYQVEVADPHQGFQPTPRRRHLETREH